MKPPRYIAAVVVLAVPLANAADAPHFGQFPVEVAPGSLRSIDISKVPKAALFKSAATAAIGQEADFAGRYVVISQGCGTSCQAIAFADVRTGIVYPADIATALGSEHRADSLLFVDTPLPALREMYGSPLPPARERTYGSRYYRWDEQTKSLKLVFKEP